MQSLRSQAKSTEPPPDSIDCPKCSGTSYQLVDGKAHLCDCAIERRVLARLPQKYHHARLEDFNYRQQQAVLDWFTTPGDGLFLTGPTGSGKTHLAAAIVRVLVELRQSVIFLVAKDLYQNVRLCYSQNLSEINLLANYKSPRYLIWDDLGAGAISEYERRVTLDVLESRINDCKPTIITSNWGLEKFALNMDERIASRIGAFRALEFAPRDRRQE